MLLPNISSKFPIFSELSVETTTAENIVYSSAILGVSGLLTVKRLPIYHLGYEVASEIKYSNSWSEIHSLLVGLPAETDRQTDTKRNSKRVHNGVGRRGYATAQFLLGLFHPTPPHPEKRWRTLTAEWRQFPISGITSVTLVARHVIFTPTYSRLHTYTRI